MGRAWPAAPGIAVGVGSGVLGLLPWLALGERLPLQNLWRTPTLPDAMPWAMLPLNQYYLPTILALLVVPGLLGGLLIGALGRADLRQLAGRGLLGFQAVAVVQSFAVLVPGLRISGLSAAYLAGLAVVSALGVGVAQAVLWLVPSELPRRTALGLIVAAVPLAQWLDAGWILVFGPFHIPPWLILATQWVPGVLVGLVLAWCTLRRDSRLGTWIVGVLVVWLVPAAFDAAGSAVARNTARDGLGAVIDRALELLRTFAGPGSQSLQGALLALGLGLVGSLGVRLARRRSSAVQLDQR